MRAARSLRVGATRRRAEVDVVRNVAGVEMLPLPLWAQVFPQGALRDMAAHTPRPVADRIRAHLTEFKLWGRQAPPLPPLPSFELPPLLGNDLDSHFRAMALQHAQPYLGYAE